jgi:recombination DNA repair RAD52 pathway protein
MSEIETNQVTPDVETREELPDKFDGKAMLPQYLNKAQLAFISQKTPKQFIKERPGPGGYKLSYVEVGYVINMLNQCFGFDWDFEVLDHQVGKTQVWVKGLLQVRVKGQIIKKVQFGGADVKINKTTQIPVSVADDLKAAASDALKEMRFDARHCRRCVLART